MFNRINYKKFLTYDERRKWYREIIDLPGIRNVGVDFRINNDNENIYGCYSTEGVIRVNLENQLNLKELITTIAHEVAHVKYFRHGLAHNNLTEKIKKDIKASIKKKVAPVRKVKNTKPKKMGVRTVKPTYGFSKKVVAGRASNLDEVFQKLI